MRIKLPHIPYIANKMMLDIANSSFVEIKDQLEKLKVCIIEVLEKDILNERKLDERVKELLEQQEDEMELMQVDRKNMFWLVKKKLAPEFNVILDSEDRHNHLAHQILEELVENDYINFIVSENRVKNLIFSSIESYLKIMKNLKMRFMRKLAIIKQNLFQVAKNTILSLKNSIKKSSEKKVCFNEGLYLFRK